jgi:hypothetical protein
MAKAFIVPKERAFSTRVGPRTGYGSDAMTQKVFGSKASKGFAGGGYLTNPDFQRKLGVGRSMGPQMESANRKAKSVMAPKKKVSIATQNVNHGALDLPVAGLNKYAGHKEGGIMKSTKFASGGSTSFKSAFREARNAGDSTFMWSGKKYTTELAKPKAAEPKKKELSDSGKQAKDLYENYANAAKVTREQAKTSYDPNQLNAAADDYESKARQFGQGYANAANTGFKRGGSIKGFAKGGGIESRGKTKGTVIKMATGGIVKLARGGGIEARGKTRGKMC